MSARENDARADFRSLFVRLMGSHQGASVRCAAGHSNVFGNVSALTFPRDT